MNKRVSDILPPLMVNCGEKTLDELLDVEWLHTNSIGAYASASVAGCNTRRYHGLLVAATLPPVGRIVALSNVMETLTVGGQTFDLATNEFEGSFSPEGWRHLERFVDEAVPRFVYTAGGLELTKEILLAETANTVAVRYTLRGGAAALVLRPFVAMRNSHHVRHADEPNRITFDIAAGGVIVHDRQNISHDLHLTSTDATFTADPQWWYAFTYRADAARGQGEPEDAYSPGTFRCELTDGASCQFVASLEGTGRVAFDAEHTRRRRRAVELTQSVGDSADAATQRLAVATDAFIARRQFAGRPSSPTILAGFPWFVDWGRDAFVAVPGLLLTTKQFALARGVFKTFASSISDGLIPNRFDDDTDGAHYNSVDASLWFIIAAERYVAASGDDLFWRHTLMPAAEAILKAYHDGTQFDIHADADGLLMAGTSQTQLTWMDAAVDGDVVTARSGRAVEVNALWYAANRIMAQRCRGVDAELADHHAHLAELMAPAFVRVFWNRRRRCLFDCITHDTVDDAVRPNQIFAVSLPYSPLSPAQQRNVVAAVQQSLLTPYGLRTLGPDEPGYCGRFEGDRATRDRAYHQGTVWPWLIGAFVEAYLKVHGDELAAVEHAERWLAHFDSHLTQAGLGSISEVFDGDAPQRPGACIAQAWSVAEVLRAKLLVAEARQRLEGAAS
jgi:predicted glycogen debranching enzyme